MKILYIQQAFKSPKQPGSTRAYWFSLELLKEGYEVTVISRRNEQPKLVQEEFVDGVKVFYIRNYVKKGGNFLERNLSFFKFTILATLLALRQRKISLVFASSTPLTMGIPALILKWFKGIPFVFEVRDLWPEAPIQLGFLKNKMLRNAALWLEKKIYSNSLHIVGLSPGMVEGIIKTGIPPTKTTMIPNMSKVDRFWKRDPNTKIASEYNINLEKFNAIHFGSMGLANGLDYIIQTARVLKEMGVNDINIIMVGHGGTKPALEQKCRALELDNVIFIDRQPMDILSEIVNLADVSLVSFLNVQILQTNSPNKLFDSLSAGLPIIVNSAGWTKELVQNGSCGAYVSPDNPQELTNLLIHWSKSPDLIKTMGAASRKLAEEVYDKSILCRQFVEVINKSVEKIRHN